MNKTMRIDPIIINAIDAKLRASDIKGFEALLRANPEAVHGTYNSLYSPSPLANHILKMPLEEGVLRDAFSVAIRLGAPIDKTDNTGKTPLGIINGLIKYCNDELKRFVPGKEPEGTARRRAFYSSLLEIIEPDPKREPASPEELLGRLSAENYYHNQVVVTDSTRSLACELVRRRAEEAFGASPARERLLSLGREHFGSVPLRNLLHTFFQGAISVAVDYSYLELNIKPWEMAYLAPWFPKNTYDRDMAVRWLMEDKLGIEPEVGNISRILAITPEQFNENGLGRLLQSRRKGSKAKKPVELIREAYPYLAWPITDSMNAAKRALAKAARE